MALAYNAPAACPAIVPPRVKPRARCARPFGVQGIDSAGPGRAITRSGVSAMSLFALVVVRGSGCTPAEVRAAVERAGLAMPAPGAVVWEVGAPRLSWGCGCCCLPWASGVWVVRSPWPLEGWPLIAAVAPGAPVVWALGPAGAWS